MIRRLLLPVAAALLAATGLVTLGAGPAAARCPSLGGPSALAKRATDVFTGELGDHRRQGGKKDRRTIWQVDVDQIYKGSIADTSVEVSAPASAVDCGLTGTSGDDYLFFAQRDGDQLTVIRGDGTGPVTAKNVAKVEDMLGSPHSPTPPAPPQATFTLVAKDAVDLQRLAAPGVALVVVGLLGLALASWRGRRAAE
ncbi:hypothetical protein [Nocardioides mangrovi]|uniref:Uncharacterized protein n=1 Tax=Nocardioides mangrovi TaxID=2874580 RepID=A0ABS7UEF9_9ACTN|nr:hypothetical protein [Nocardioides mangrovi]MBZ5739390.1 hypothetical protein [Nocardioides mangrovi]